MASLDPSLDLGQAVDRRRRLSRRDRITGAQASPPKAACLHFAVPAGCGANSKPKISLRPKPSPRDPKLIWEWYDWRRQEHRQGQTQRRPQGSREAREVAKRNFTLITQNVDGLHDLAGSGKILKLHGDIWRVRCTVCGAEFPHRRTPLPKIPPHCACGGLLRPAVVWFGESLPSGMMAEAEHAVSAANVLLVVGTSAQVYPAASLIPFARQSGAKVVEVNVDDTQYSNAVDCVLRGPSGEILPQLIG